MIRQKLRVDSIDLLQFHVWDDSWVDEPDFRNTVEKLKRDGTIRSFGLSLNFVGNLNNGLKALRTGLVDAVQVILQHLSISRPRTNFIHYVTNLILELSRASRSTKAASAER